MDDILQHVRDIIAIMESENIDYLSFLKKISKCIQLCETQAYFVPSEESNLLERKLHSTIYTMYNSFNEFLEVNGEYTCYTDLCFLIVGYLRMGRVYPLLMHEKYPSFQYFKIPNMWSHDVQHVQSLSMKGLYDMLDLFTWKLFADLLPKEVRNDAYIDESYNWLLQLINRAFVILTMKEGDITIMDCPQFVHTVAKKKKEDDGSIHFNSRASADRVDDYIDTFISLKFAHSIENESENQKTMHSNFRFLSEICTMIFGLHREYIFFFALKNQLIEKVFKLERIRKVLYERLSKIDSGSIAHQYKTFIYARIVHASDRRMFQSKYPFEKNVKNLTILLRKKYDIYNDDDLPKTLKELFQKELRNASDFAFHIENIQSYGVSFENTILCKDWYDHPPLENGPIIIYLFIIKKFAVITSWDINTEIPITNSFLEAFAVLRQIMRMNNISSIIRQKNPDGKTLSGNTLDISVYDHYLFENA